MIYNLSKGHGEVVFIQQTYMIVLTKKLALVEINLNAKWDTRDSYAHNAAEILITQFMLEAQGVNAQDVLPSILKWGLYFY
jgi:hypothetical protein